jgi:cold shock protein
LLRGGSLRSDKMLDRKRLTAAMLAPHLSVFFRRQSDLGDPAGDVSWQCLANVLAMSWRRDRFGLSPKIWLVARSAVCTRRALCSVSALAYALIGRQTMQKGTVKWFNSTKGYGFIKPSSGDKDVFVHISAVERAGLRSLNEGQEVEYELVTNRGRTSAENLKVA